MAKARKKTMEETLLQMAKEMAEADVDYRTFHNTFFGPDSELLAGKTKEERRKLIQGQLYKALKEKAIELGIAQGYLERDDESGQARERHFSGTFVMRLPSSLHRQLVVEARREGVSLNQLCTAKLARPLG